MSVKKGTILKLGTELPFTCHLTPGPLSISTRFGNSVVLTTRTRIASIALDLSSHTLRTRLVHFRSACSIVRRSCSFSWNPGFECVEHFILEWEVNPCCQRVQRARSHKGEEWTYYVESSDFKGVVEYLRKAVSTGLACSPITSMKTDRGPVTHSLATMEWLWSRDGLVELSRDSDCKEPPLLIWSTRICVFCMDGYVQPLLILPGYCYE